MSCAEDAPSTPPLPRTLGYARVSTDSQALAPQVESLKVAGADQVFRETASGAKRNRAQLARLLREVGSGDVVLVTRLDRLARSTRDLLNVLGALADKGAAFRSLGDPWADTTSPHGRLMLTVLAGLAEFERAQMTEQEKTAADLKAAQDRVAALEAQIAEQQHQAAVAEALKTAGLPADLAGRLQGSTPEELAADPERRERVLATARELAARESAARESAGRDADGPGNGVA